MTVYSNADSPLALAGRDVERLRLEAWARQVLGAGRIHTFWRSPSEGAQDMSGSGAGTFSFPAAGVMRVDSGAGGGSYRDMHFSTSANPARAIPAGANASWALASRIRVPTVLDAGGLALVGSSGGGNAIYIGAHSGISLTKVSARVYRDAGNLVDFTAALDLSSIASDFCDVLIWRSGGVTRFRVNNEPIQSSANGYVSSDQHLYMIAVRGAANVQQIDHRYLFAAYKE